MFKVTDLVTEETETKIPEDTYFAVLPETTEAESTFESLEEGLNLLPLFSGLPDVCW